MSIFNFFKRRAIEHDFAGPLEQLESLGYLKFTPEQERDRVREHLLASLKQGYLNSDWNDEGISGDRRIHPADNEDLAEGGIAECLQQMKAVLLQEGVRFQRIQEFLTADVHYVDIDGRRFMIYDRSHTETEWYWANALKRLCEITNHMLQRANSDERLFAIYGGNDGHVMLLTPDMHGLIANLAFISREWLPYRAEEINLADYES